MLASQVSFERSSNTIRSCHITCTSYSFKSQLYQPVSGSFPAGDWASHFPTSKWEGRVYNWGCNHLQ